MQIITCAVIKGGTGKTATCGAIAQAGALEGKKVLCIDLDPQANLTSMLDADSDRPGAAELMQGGKAAELIQSTEQGIDIIAGNNELAIDTAQNKTMTIYALADAIEPIKKAYDLIIIDTPPAFSNLTYNAIQCATGLIIPICADNDSYNGLLYILEVAKLIKKTNKKLHVLGCIITQYNPRTNISRLMRDIIEKNGKGVKCPLLAEIRQGVALQEARALHKNLFEYAPKSKPAQDYMKLYNEIIK